MSEKAIRHVEDESRYELLVDGVLVSVVGYSRRGDVVVLANTATEPEFRHRGHATELVGAVLHDLESQGVRTLVHCPFIRWYQEQHPPTAVTPA